MTQSTPLCHRWSGLSSPTGNHYIGNLLGRGMEDAASQQHLLCAGFSKRHGIEVTETVFVLMVWKWLNVASIAMFCRNALGMFSRAKKDVLYDFLKREDINWRKFNMDTAKEVYKQQGLDDSRVKAFVLDDSVKARRGKKMEGVSREVLKLLDSGSDGVELGYGSRSRRVRMRTPGFFDLEERFAKLDGLGDPMVKVAEVVRWEGFRGALDTAFAKARKSNAAARSMIEC